MFCGQGGFFRIGQSSPGQETCPLRSTPLPIMAHTLFPYNTFKGSSIYQNLKAQTHTCLPLASEGHPKSQPSEYLWGVLLPTGLRVHNFQQYHSLCSKTVKPSVTSPQLCNPRTIVIDFTSTNLPYTHNENRVSSKTIPIWKGLRWVHLRDSS